MRADVPSAAFKARATNPGIQPILAAYPAGNRRHLGSRHQPLCGGPQQ